LENIFGAGGARHRSLTICCSWGAQTLTVSASYQSCNDKLCLPPKTVKVQLPVTVQ